MVVRTSQWVALICNFTFFCFFVFSGRPSFAGSGYTLFGAAARWQGNVENITSAGLAWFGQITMTSWLATGWFWEKLKLGKQRAALKGLMFNREIRQSGPGVIATEGKVREGAQEAQKTDGEGEIGGKAGISASKRILCY